MKMLRFAVIGASAALLSACGGSGGGGVASTPAPPTSGTNTSLTNLQFSQDFTARSGYVQYTISRATGNATVRSPVANSGAQVRYDAATQSYTLIGSLATQSTFGPSNRLASGSNATITSYRKTSGNRQEDLALFNPGAGNPDLALTYTSYGALQTITDNGTSLDVDTSFFTYGVQTAASDMPRTGTATYRTKIDGQFADGSGAYALGGTSSFAADFAAGTIAVSLTPVGQNVVTGGIRNFATQTITGTITSPPVGPSFSGTGSGGAYSTSLVGYFYGPAAAEIGGTFAMSGAGGAGVGALVGKKN